MQDLGGGMRAHVIDNGVVTNTIEVESLDFLPGLIDASMGGAIGDSWDGESFTQPPDPQQIIVPEAITRWQALTILNQSGLLDAAEAYVGSLTDRQAQIDFTAASVWRRDWFWLDDAATALGLTGEQVDQMFIAASAL